MSSSSTKKVPPKTTLFFLLVVVVAIFVSCAADTAICARCGGSDRGDGSSGSDGGGLLSFFINTHKMNSLVLASVKPYDTYRTTMTSTTKRRIIASRVTTAVMAWCKPYDTYRTTNQEEDHVATASPASSSSFQTRIVAKMTNSILSWCKPFDTYRATTTTTTTTQEEEEEEEQTTTVATTRPFFQTTKIGTKVMNAIMYWCKPYDTYRCRSNSVVIDESSPFRRRHPAHHSFIRSSLSHT